MNSEDVNEVIREEIESLFSEGKKLEITFTKANGERRILKCVNTPDVVGVDFEYKSSEKTPSDVTKSVWDIENDGWRSFKWESVIGFNELV